MHGDHTQIKSFYQEITNRLLYTTPWTTVQDHLTTRISLIKTLIENIIQQANTNFAHQDTDWNPNQNHFYKHQHYAATTASKTSQQNQQRKYLQQQQQRQIVYIRGNYSIENFKAKSAEEISTAKTKMEDNLQ